MKYEEISKYSNNSSNSNSNNSVNDNKYAKPIEISYKKYWFKLFVYISVYQYICIFLLSVLYLLIYFNLFI